MRNAALGKADWNENKGRKFVLPLNETFVALVHRLLKHPHTQYRHSNPAYSLCFFLVQRTKRRIGNGEALVLVDTAAGIF